MYDTGNPPRPSDLGYSTATQGSPAGWQSPAPPPPPPSRGVSTRAKVVTGIAVLAVGVAGGALYAGFTPGSVVPPPHPAATQVRLEQTSTAGANPFLTVPAGQDQSNVAAPAGAGGQFAGDTPGLFGDSGDKPSCDAQGLVSNLRADPTKSAGWAQALGINAGDIPDYVNTLNPVVLRSDTAVTSYGYQDGAFVPYPAVLQAGTAVFVNDKGEPRVKCYSGNPLSRGQQFEQADYVGPTWDHFAPTSLTYVAPAPTVIDSYVVADVYSAHPHPWRARAPWRGEEHCYCDQHPDSPRCPGHSDRYPGGHSSDERRSTDHDPGDQHKPGDHDPGEHRSDQGSGDHGSGDQGDHKVGGATTGGPAGPGGSDGQGDKAGSHNATTPGNGTQDTNTTPGNGTESGRGNTANHPGKGDKDAAGTAGSISHHDLKSNAPTNPSNGQPNNPPALVQLPNDARAIKQPPARQPLIDQQPTKLDQQSQNQTTQSSGGAHHGGGK